MSSSSSSNSSTSTAAVLSRCVEEVLLQDLAYAACVMDSGLFAISKRAPFSASLGLVAALANASTASQTYATALLANSSQRAISYGTCELLCTAPTLFGASDSCCRAASNVLACESTNPDIAGCKQVLESALALKHECGISAQNVGLLAATGVIICLLVAVLVLAKWHARQQGRKTLAALEARLAAGVLTTWSAFLAAWNQIANLVWKNLVLRRRKPLALVLEQILPLLLVGGLVFLANLDNIFPDLATTATNDNTEAQFPNSTVILCTSMDDLDATAIGAPSKAMTTFYSTGQSVLGMFLLISYIKFVSTNTTTMVIEKETRIREVMKIMGLSDVTLLLSWALTSMVVSTPLAFAIAAELKYGNVFPSTEFATLVFLFWSFSLAIVAFSYFITPFFNKSRTASIASVLLWLMLYFPFFSVQAKTNGTKYLAALSPPTAFALAVDDLLRHAQLGTGFAYSIGLLAKPILVPSAFSMAWMLLLDTVILFALGWYLEQVLPQQYGVRKPWNFLFKREYWLKPVETEPQVRDLAMVPSPAESASPRSDFSPMEELQLPGYRPSHSLPLMKQQSTFTDVVEPVTAALAAQERKGTCLQIQDLRKVFKVEDGEKVAVHQLNLTMYSGQITALLGHNGAGKTTTISMLTGLTPPTSGDATLFGRSIRHDFHELRQIMGICPQHDVLFNDMTVEEHLKLFGTMKNVPPQQLNDEVDKMIREVGLTEKRKVQSKNLSGGQKRKLSVALAFIGDSKLVFLDEPTSGMDPYSRRFTWNLLQRNREDRVIVLTTHFMDEADILGDRIAIMADGQLCCAGSSLFLKNRYGAGYNLTIIKRPDCDVEQIARFLRKYVDDAKCLSNYGSETVFQLPSSAAAMFPSLMQSLDHELANLRIQQYGVSVTTLEEVFLRIARDREEGGIGADGFLPVDQIRKTSATSTQSRPTAARISAVTTHAPTQWTQYTALLTKRFRISKRDRKNWVNAVCIPIIFLIILVLLPEINVANFLPDYSVTYASEARQDNCTAANFTAAPFSRDDQLKCLSSEFGYCSIGIVDCDAALCCTQTYIESPYYPCNTCLPTGTNPCFNPKCMTPNGAKLQLTLNAFLVSLVVMLAFAFVPAAIVAFIVREKNPIQNAKSLQLICGANVSAYWLANWTHDVLLIFVSVILAIVAVPFSNKTLSNYEEVVGVGALIVGHALTVVPLAYLFSFRFNKHAVAQTSLLVFALSTGGLLSIFSFLCRIVDFDLAPNSSSGGLSLSTLDRNYLRWVFMLFPGYALNSGVYEIGTRGVGRDSLFGIVDKTPSSFFGLFEGLGATECTLCWEKNVPGCCQRSVFQLDVAGAPVLYLAVEALLFTVWVFLRDRNSIHWHRERTARSHVPGEDDDVAHERLKVQSVAPSKTDAIFIRNLRQQYAGGKVALDDLCLAVPKGECFGYLGINGAGKSTTMKVLTGQIAPTNGFVTLGGYDLSSQRDKARTVIGYCPQFDSLHDLLTVEEQLELYARLKGIHHSQVRGAVDQKIAEVGLDEYRTKLTRGLSGGNKRKVSTAIALMGAPRIIFLDEPSTGVDPSSRRKMWDVIAGVCAEKDSCVVLTTHSMEECEALSTRVGILVSGKLKCLGTVGHLKQKFGKGYTVEVKLSDPPSHVTAQLRDQVEAVLGANTPITNENVIQVCRALGSEGRGRAILGNDGNAWVLNAILASAGQISVDVFCNWWGTETMSRGLVHFFYDEFHGSKLVEQQSDHFRFQVPKQSLRPFQIFRLLEESKQRLFVSEYSVSDTSLEHIFNNMAAQQDEEHLISNGMYDELAVGGGGYGDDYNLRPSSLQSVRSFHRSSSLRRSSFLG